jgi:hypothetical protein
MISISNKGVMKVKLKIYQVLLFALIGFVSSLPLMSMALCGQGSGGGP